MRRFVFVTGHQFGVAAFRRLMSCDEFRKEVECALLIGLDPRLEQATSGFVDVRLLAREFTVPFAYTSSIKTETAYERVLAAAPDLLFVIGWSELAPPSMLDIPMQLGGHTYRHGRGHGCIGMHPTLLPEGRGRAPIPWTIIRGLKRSGVTSFMLEETPDSGPIVGQVAFDVTPDETSSTLFMKALAAHQDLADELALQIARSVLAFEPQDETRASVWPKRRPKDSEIDFCQDATTIERLVRALSPPYPRAFTWIGGVRLEVHSVEVVNCASECSPGVVVYTEKNGAPVLATASSLLRLTAYSPADFCFVPGQAATTEQRFS